MMRLFFSHREIATRSEREYNLENPLVTEIFLRAPEIPGKKGDEDRVAPRARDPRIPEFAGEL